jgi:hypothetical protein
MKETPEQRKRPKLGLIISSTITVQFAPLRLDLGSEHQSDYTHDVPPESLIVFELDAITIAPLPVPQVVGVTLTRELLFRGECLGVDASLRLG